jgi:hypothetical protein
VLWRYLKDHCSAVLGAKQGHQSLVIQLGQGRQLPSVPASQVQYSDTLDSPSPDLDMVSAAVYAPETPSGDPSDSVEAAGIGGKGFEPRFS